jgi:hypothetical protein
MEDLVGTAVRVARARHLADEWAVVLAAGSIPHRLRLRLDGWALIVAVHDAEAAREALGAYDRENIAGEWWRTVTALTLYADAPHVLGNAAASVVLVGAVSQNRPRCRPLAATPRRRRRQRPHRRRPRRPPPFRWATST